MIQNISAIEYEGRLGHTFVNTLVIQRLEFIPLRQHRQSVGAIARRVGIGSCGDSRTQARVGFLAHVARVVHFHPHVFALHLRIIDVDFGLLEDKVAYHKHAGSFAHVPCILLEGISQNGDLFARDGVEHARHHLLREALLLVIVHDDHIIPVVRAFFQAIRLAEVDEVEDVLLEAGAAKTDGGVEETFADAIIHADGAGDFGYVGSGGLTQRGYGVDG
mmetsp:Transcript_14641/g.35284  ORF Transcript_14641/g.35284 Transcript_14641/m.35284 type:complete len:219 (+) Transcript_14641:206-862(+)